MKPLQRVLWSEGMMMSPHHLQQQDRYHEARLEERIRGVSPYSWGLNRLVVDERALESGQIAIEELQAVLPGGTLICAGPGEADNVPARPLEAHFAPGAASLKVYVGLPREPEGRATLDEVEGSTPRRFKRVPRQVLDANLAASPLPMEFAARNLRILFGDEPLEDYECFQVLELVRDANGRLEYSASFVAPCLSVGASPFLVASLRRTFSLVVNRQRQLAEQQRQRSAASVEFHAHDVTRFLQLASLNRAIPVLRFLLESGNLAPLQVYLSLVQLTGELSTFSAGMDLEELPGYVHASLRETFEPLFALLTSLLVDTLSGRCIVVPLESREDGMHLAKLDAEEMLKPGVRFALSIESSVTEQAVQQTAPRLAKVGSWGEIAQLVSTATSGVQLTFDPRPAKEFPLRAGRTYFSLDTSATHWRRVMEERTFAVHLPPSFEVAKTRVELLAVPLEA